MKPPAPNPRGQAVAWAQTFCEDWEACRDDLDYAPEYAWSLLAAWGTVCRFYARTELPTGVAALPSLVQQDASALLTMLRQAPEPAEWLKRARRLDRAWDHAIREDALRDLRAAAIDLFDQFDRHSLAVCMARRLTPAGGETTGWLADWARQVEQAEEFFAAHVDAFLPAAFLANVVIANCRPNLDEADPELWLTTLKHRRLKEAWKEAETTGSPQSLTERDKQAIQAKVAPRVEATAMKLQPGPPNSPVPNTVPFLDWTPVKESVAYALAAGPPPPEEERLFCELAGQDTEEAPTNDYRRAWAHLLASLSRGTDVREAWLQHFIDLAEVAAQLDSGWAERLRRAHGLRQDHDWERRHLDDGIRRLEPRTFASLSHLVHWLQELVSLSPQGPRA